MGTPEFNNRVGVWVKALCDHMKSVAPQSRLGLLLVDEPASLKQAQTIIDWATAIRSVPNSALIFEDPFFTDVNSDLVKKVFSLSDIVCINQTLVQQKPELHSPYLELAKGKELWLYDTQSNPKEYDPTDYYRLFSWRALDENASGLLYWSFTDLGENQDAWDDEAQLGNGCSPIFLGLNNRLATSLHWEAMRDGLWDNQIFRELEHQSVGTSSARAAIAIIDAAKRLGRDKSGSNPWSNSDDSKEAEILRNRALDLLERINKTR